MHSMTAVIYALVIGGLALLLVAIEIGFRRRHRRRVGRDYFVSLRFPWHEQYVIAHPYLSFAYRPNCTIRRNQRLPYDLHPYRYWSFRTPLRLNNMGHFGPDFETERRPGVLRVACLGNSSTANNVADDEADYSYPALLEVELKREGPAEVYNCGIGGWTSAEILIDFALSIVHTRPDYVILYHGYCDLFVLLQEGFSWDYSHGRKSLGTALHRLRWANRLPKFSAWHSYEWLKDRLFSSGNVRNEVLRCIRVARPDFAQPLRTLAPEEANIRHLLALCEHHGIRVIIGSYAHYCFDPGDVALRGFHAGVLAENQMLQRLATELDLPFVDVMNAIPQDAEHFLDNVHFTPRGMQRLAELFAAALRADLSRRTDLSRRAGRAAVVRSTLPTANDGGGRSISAGAEDALRTPTAQPAASGSAR